MRGDLPVDDADLQRDPVEELAEEFLQRRRSGGRPSVEEYAERYPQWAPRIRDLFPTLLLIEEFKPETPGSGTAQPASETEAPLTRLGDYRIIREIGRGGMGVVYEAQQESLSRRVAVKVLPGVYLSSPKSLKRFRREARAAARLHHTNIVPIFGFGQQDGIHYYVMQYIRGQGLDRVLTELNRRRSPRTAGGSRDATEAENGSPEGAEDCSAADVARTVCWGRFARTAAVPLPDPLTPLAPPPGNGRANDATPASSNTCGSSSSGDASSDPHTSGPGGGEYSAALAGEVGQAQYWRSVAGIGVQVAAALHYAHNQGTLHRDIKPGNLLLDTQGTVWIADFGLAKLAEQDDLTHSGDVVGTLRYMAPEQFEGRADARSDVYGLGLTLYELLTLRPAFDQQDRGRLIRQVSQEEPPSPRKINPEIPRDLETIVVKAIARHPDHRYGSAAALAEDLERFLEDRPILARRTSPIGRLWRWCRRNRAVAALSGLALALLVAVAVVGTAGYIRTSAALERESIERRNAEDARRQAVAEGQKTEAEYQRAEGNLRLAIQAFEEVFDKIAAAPTVRPLEQIPTDSDAAEGDEKGEQSPTEAWEELATLSAVTQKEAAVLESMLKFYDRFAQQNRGNTNLQEDTVRAYRRVGDIQQRLGNLEAAENAYRQALAICRGLAEGPSYVVEAAAIENKLGTIYRKTGRFTQAAEANTQARDLLLALPAEAAALPQSRLELARTYNLLAGGQFDPGMWRPRQGPPGAKPNSFGARFMEMLGNHKKALDILRALVEEDPGNPAYQLDLARTYRDLSQAGRWGRPQEAEEARQQALDILKKLVADYPANPDYRFELAETYAMTSHPRGPGPSPGRSRDETPPEQTQDSEKNLAEAIRIEAQLVQQFPDVPQYQAALARLYYRQGYSHRPGQDDVANEESLRRAVQLQKALAERYSDVPQYQGELARNLFMLSYHYRKSNRPVEARDTLKEAIASLESVLDSGRNEPLVLSFLPRAYQSLAEIHQQLGETAEAEAAREKAKELAAKAPPMPHGPFHFDRGDRNDRGRTPSRKRSPRRDRDETPTPAPAT